MTNLLFDVGNSCLKMAVYTDNQLEYLQVFSSHQLLTVNELLLSLKKQKYNEVGCCSVNPKWDKVLRELTQKLGVPFKQIDHEIELKIEVAPDTISANQIGADLKLYAYSAVKQGYNNAIIISLGTATTISVLQEGLLSYGIIGLGLYSGLKGLQNALPSLSGHTKLEFCPQKAGRNTPEAINFGLVNMNGFAIKGFIESLISPSYQPKLIITGGDAPLLYPFLTQHFKIEYQPQILFKGLNELLNREHEGTNEREISS